MTATAALARPGRDACPICSSSAAPDLLTAWESLTWWSCRSCGGGWREPYRPETVEADSETVDTYARYLDNRRLFDAIATEKARWIRSSIPLENASVVEVGPGVGAVADALVRDGLPASRYTALESNAAFAQSLAARGFTVIQGSGVDALAAAASRDAAAEAPVAVILDNVLEHVPEPRVFLRALRDALRGPAIFLIEVPNERGLRWRAPLQDALRGVRKPPTFPGHINLFTRGSLSGLLRDACGGRVAVRLKGLRHPDEVRRLLQSETVPAAVGAVLALLRVFPLDRLLGVAYFLRATVRVSPRETRA